MKLARGILILGPADDAKRDRAKDVLAWAAIIVAEIGLRPFARAVKIDPGNLARFFSSERERSADALSKIEKACATISGSCEKPKSSYFGTSPRRLGDSET